LKEKAGLNVEEAAEQRRMTDLRAKLERLLADCDLLLVPRMTLRNAAQGDSINPRVYQLDNAQVEALADFVKSGKPVLACFGPMASPGGPPAGPDSLEELFARLGVKFGKQT